MLRSALERTKENLFIEILSYREITIKTMKNGKASAAVPPEQASKRFLILNYHIDFEKIQFPISIKYFAEASPERLKLTIKRMAQEIGAFRNERNQSEVERENAYLKYELDSLKAKQKNVGKMEGSSIVQSRVEDLQREVA
jgi:coiled-coil domain-containing protein 61